MKVISGKIKGKNLKGFDIDGTRPTQDRVKESLFGMIQNYVLDSVVLDLFAGSGSLGIEALSNNSRFCYFVDKNNIAIKTIEENLKGTAIDNYETIKSDYMTALKIFSSKNIKFDIIFLDPPYNLDCISEIINYILENDLLNSEGIIVCEAEFDNFNKEYEGLELIKFKKYGYKFIKIYKKI